MGDGRDTVVGDAVQEGTGMVWEVMEGRLEGGDPLGIDEG